MKKPNKQFSHLKYSEFLSVQKGTVDFGSKYVKVEHFDKHVTKQGEERGRVRKHGKVKVED